MAFKETLRVVREFVSKALKLPPSERSFFKKVNGRYVDTPLGYCLDVTADFVDEMENFDGLLPQPLELFLASQFNSELAYNLKWTDENLDTLLKATEEWVAQQR